MSAVDAAPTALRSGYRGYITPRLVRGSRTPQHVQNLVIRDYAVRNGLLFKLSATEYVMPGCTMILQSVLDELPTLEGIIAFSLFMLPRNQERRRRIYQRVLDSEARLHFAVEGLALTAPVDMDRVEDVLAIERSLANVSVPGTLWTGAEG